MRLSSKIHRVEQQGIESLHLGAERARSGAKQLRNRVHQTLHAVAQHLPMSFHGEEELPKPQVRQGIVSINGQDVGTLRCTGGRKTP